MVVEMRYHTVNTSFQTNVPMVKFSTLSPLSQAGVSGTILPLIHLTVTSRTVQRQLMKQPNCVTDIVVATSVNRFSSTREAVFLLCVSNRVMETTSESHIIASRVRFCFISVFCYTVSHANDNYDIQAQWLLCKAIVIIVSVTTVLSPRRYQFVMINWYAYTDDIPLYHVCEK